MDDPGFAQSRGDDDLFDDELIPIEPTEVEVVTQQVQETTISSEPPKEPAPKGPAVRGGPNKARGAGRGRGGGGRGGGGGGSATAPQQNTKADTKPDTKAATVEVPESTDAPVTPAPAESVQDEEKKDAKTDQTPRPQAVRGDRTATGGVKKPKLTEEELSAKMAEAKLRATSLAEAHARAVADAASFEERERIAMEKRKVMVARDAANRKVMDSEREANRRRKMQAQSVREWDQEKNEEDFTGRGRGRGGFMRGAHGGVKYDRRPNGEDQDALDQGHEDGSGYRGRGGHGRGRGRGGRGGRDHHNNEPGSSSAAPKNGLNSSKYATQPDFSKESEFPPLPPGMKPTVGPEEKPAETTTSSTTAPTRPAQTGRKVSDILGGTGETGTWAEQVESSSAAAN